MVRPLFRQLLLGALALATIDLAAGGVTPVLRGREPLGERLFAAAGWRDSVLAHSPWIHADSAEAIGTPQFDADRRAFAEDLMRTGHVDSLRADSLADAAVREAYVRRVPPALVLGVMLTENDVLKSSARSNVGALGLMQVHARSWRSLRSRFGSNLRDDRTNLRYGVYILGYFLKKPKDGVEANDLWRVGLLRYNGCVHGTNTSDCSRYPDKVREEVEQSAQSTCRGKGFGRCVAQPLMLSARLADAED
ncbi:MAG: lytic transglycosylase domain-containing protein [Gemmatimonadaceae bacterium]|nr:lytic transglycosylase domain-containing protein [Gemmatimonadaceae bacterium]